VHEQDLSKATDVRAQAPKKYDPDSAWQKAEELQEGTASEAEQQGKGILWLISESFCRSTESWIQSDLALGPPSDSQTLTDCFVNTCQSCPSGA